MKSLSFKLGIILLVIGLVAILNCSQQPTPEEQPASSSAKSIDVSVVRTEVDPSGSFRVYYKVTNLSGKDVRAVKLTCVLLNVNNKEIAFGMGIVEKIPRGDTAYDWVPINVSPSEVNSVGFRIDKIYY